MQLQRITPYVFVVLIVLLVMYGWTGRWTLIPSGRSSESIRSSHFVMESPNGTVGILTNETQLKLYLTENNPRGVNCTFDILKDHFLASGRFYGQGMWYAPPSGKITRKTTFYPIGCSFPNRFGPNKGLKHCMDRGLKRILITGDSNGRRTTQALVPYLESFLVRIYKSSSCKRVRAFDAKHQDYFDTPNVSKPLIEIHQCELPWSHCVSFQYECSLKNKTTQLSTLLVEYISIFHWVDSTIQIRPKTLVSTKPLSAENQMEYLLKYYLPYRGFPDVWIFKAPFQHEIWKSSLKAMTIDIDYVLHQLDIYLPHTTQIIFTGSNPECEYMRKPVMEMNFNAKWHIRMNTRLEEMNRLMYKNLKQYIQRKSHFHVFMDPASLVSPVKCPWHRDHAHMQPQWYIKLSTYILEMACAQF